MGTVRDLSWMKYLHAAAAAERFSWGRFSVATAIAYADGSGNHERFRFRLLAFEKGSKAPWAIVNLESDLFGAWKLSMERDLRYDVLASFDTAPDYDAFRSMAVAALDRADEAARDSGATARRRAPRKPRSPSTRGH